MAGPTRSTTYAAGLAAVLALAGCGTGGETPGGPTSVVTSAAVSRPWAAPTTTPSASVDPVLARIPAAARPETQAGAEAFVKFYFEQVNVAFKNASSHGLEDLTSSDCELCSGMAEGVTSMAAKDRHYGGDLAEVTYLRAIEFTPTARRVLVEADQQQVSVMDKAGQVVDTTSAANLGFVATLEFDGRWVITRMQKAKS